jgi:hypothetical protein
VDHYNGICVDLDKTPCLVFDVDDRDLVIGLVFGIDLYCRTVIIMEI